MVSAPSEVDFTIKSESFQPPFKQCVLLLAIDSDKFNDLIHPHPESTAEDAGVKSE